MAIEVTVAYFRTRFKELAAAPDALVQACLDDATVTHTGPTWHPDTPGPVGDRTRLAILYLAANMVALSPGAKCLRLEAGLSTVYEKRWRQLAYATYGGPRVL